MTQTRRKFVAAAALGASLPVAVHGKGARTFAVAGPWEIGGLAPALSGHIFARLGILETLIDVAADGTPAPQIASAWRVSHDRLRWEFDINTSRRFHDGSPVNAPAVALGLHAAAGSAGALSWAPILRIEATNAALLTIELKQPYAALWAALAHSSSALLAPASFDAKQQVMSVIGCGPYRITELAAPQRLNAQAVDVKFAIQSLTYLAAGRVETRAIMAQSGQADLAIGLDPASLQRLKGHRNVNTHAALLPRTVAIKVNCGHPWLADIRMRQALSMAIDRAGIAYALLRDAELAATQLFSPSLRAWHRPQLPPLRFDLHEAKRLIAACGWTAEISNGAPSWKNAKGQTLSLTLRTFPDRPELPMIATALQEQWRQVGIAVNVLIGNSGEVPRSHRDGSLQLALIARNYANTAEPSGTLLQDFGTRERNGVIERGGDWGAMGWANENVTLALTRVVQHGGDASERTQIAATLQAELPVIPVAWYRLHAATSARVRGLTLDPFERSYFLDRLSWAAGT